MKKLITTFMMFAMLAVMVPFMATSADAQTRYRTNRNNYSRNYDRYDDRSTYDKHRNLINIGVGTGAGALIGALIGGKKGALVGAAAGAGGSALYSYVLNPKTKKYERVYRRR